MPLARTRKRRNARTESGVVLSATGVILARRSAAREAPTDSRPEPPAVELDPTRHVFADVGPGPAVADAMLAELDEIDGALRRLRRAPRNRPD